jgi:hypothetical protein
MPIAPIKFRPGINTTFTPTLNEGGWSDSQLIRFVAGLPQKIGGWTKYWPFSIGSPVRALCDWLDFNANSRLAVGATETLGVIASGTLADITPQTLETDFVADIETTSGSSTVTITDTNIDTVTTFDSIYFRTPISVGGIILSGLHPITLVTGATSFEIDAGVNATATVSTVAITGATQANPCVVTAVAHGRSNGDYVYIAGVVGMTQLNGNIYEVANVAADTFELVGIDSGAYTAYSSGGFVYGGIVPQFEATTGSASLTVILPDHGLSVGGRITFPESTSVGGITVSGTYLVTSVPGGSSDEFTIAASSTASTTETVPMNGGEAGLLYYISLGPPAAGAGYGLGDYGEGAYGLGTATAAQTGTQITATDWTLDTWGQTLIACPENGGIYYWQPDGGFTTATLIATDKAPLFNTGVFVAQPAQILVAYGSTTQITDNVIGFYQDPLLIRWCDQDNFEDWSISTTDQVGSARIPRGSRIVGGTQGPNQALIWTDAGVWTMTYVGQPLVFTFNEIGTGCGLIAKHAVAVLQERTFWMGTNNFYTISGNGVEPVPCTVWDDVFQDLDTANQSKCWAWATSTFSEVWFFYPSLRDATGECTRYVKLGLGAVPAWDKGQLPRSAGIDQSSLDYPISATSSGLIYQHEDGNNADGSPLEAHVESGEVMIADGNETMFVDQVRPDMVYSKVGSDDEATLTITLTAYNDISGTEMSSGALSYTEDTTYLSTRVRGHRLKFRIASADLDSFWRVGLMRYRAARDGRF